MSDSEVEEGEGVGGWEGLTDLLGLVGGVGGWEEGEEEEEDFTLFCRGMMGGDSPFADNWSPVVFS